MFYNKIQYSYKDITVIPAVISKIKSRSECNPVCEDGCMPIFTAPMASVVDTKNYDKWIENKITPILPRNIQLKDRIFYSKNGNWAAFSLNEFQEFFCNHYATNTSEPVWKVLIDIANGHMKCLYDLVRKAKDIHGDKICVMVGNIANPETYRKCVEAGVWGVRVGVGAGNGCITSSNVSVHYAMGSLIDETYKVKQRCFATGLYQKESLPKIIADGGVRNYSDVIKALALGADYVMIGSLFASLEESAGKTTILPNGDKCKEFYGMASKQGQIAINGKKTKTSEGISKTLPIIGTIPQWSDNMNAYLRSAMSYCNVEEIKDFNPENVNTAVLSCGASGSINK